MVIIVDRKKAYVNPQLVDFENGLKVNGETVAESLTEVQKTEILNAFEYDSVVYVYTE